MLPSQKNARRFTALHVGAALLLAAMPFGGCTCAENKPSPPDASASATASASAAGSAGPSIAPRQEEDIKPAYPLIVPPHPLAQRYCEALHDAPAKRKAECCSEHPGMTMTSECIRTLSFAIQEKAVTVEPADLDRCVEALGKAYEGCAWVGPNPVRMPEVCLGIFKGAVVQGGVCRSSVECAVGMNCQGAGPTRLGKCGPPRPARAVCDLTIDTLAAHMRQDDTDAKHPECVGYCLRHVCFEAVPVGAACKVTPECGPGKTCASGKCSDAPLPAVGTPCPGGACATSDARCIKGQCVSPKPEGEACALDYECRGGCIRPDGGTKGKCGKKCGWL